MNAAPTSATRGDRRAEQPVLAPDAPSSRFTLRDRGQPRSTEPDGPRGGYEARTVAQLVRHMAAMAGLRVEVVVDASLVANAAAGERSVFLADRRFGVREAHRIAVHEVLGHLVAAANARTQPLAIFGVGTAGSFEDQEGLCILLEELAGVLDGTRMRTLAARVLATDRLHARSSFEDTARSLVDEHGFGAREAFALTERAYRGGGLARDCAYLRGWLRVREAYHAGHFEVDELRAGRLSLDALGPVRALREQGWAREALYKPSLVRSLEATARGTSFETSPPSLVTSFTRFEAT